MKNYYIEFDKAVIMDGIKYRGCCIMARDIARASVRFCEFIEKNKVLNVSVKSIREVKYSEIVMIKDKSEYRWNW